MEKKYGVVGNTNINKLTGDFNNNLLANIKKYNIQELME